MCLANTMEQGFPEKDPDLNGKSLTYFFLHFKHYYLLIAYFVLLSILGHNKEANNLSGSSVKTTKRSFSLLNSNCSVGSAIPVHQIVSLVSMTSPRTYRPHRISNSPAFIEFDMTESGYG